MKQLIEAPKPVTTVQNVDRQEKRHNGVDTYTGATGEVPADDDDDAAEAPAAEAPAVDAAAADEP